MIVSIKKVELQMQQIKTIEDTMSYKISTRLLMQKALEKGYVLTYFPSSPSTGSGITRGEKNRKELFFKSTCTALVPSLGVYAAENKFLTYSLLVGSNINTPSIIALKPDDAWQNALPMLEKYKTIVVKPSDMNHGDGVTVGILDVQSLQKAIEFARRNAGPDSDTLVQQEVTGKEYRFLVVDGKVVAVAGRCPAFVVGDGVHTILELIEEKNQDPRRGDGHASELTKINTDDVRHHKGGAFLGHILLSGQEANVLETSNLSRGGESTDYTDMASSAIKKMAVVAAKSCFLAIAGVDIITKDITADSLEDSYIIEVNLTPGIRMHQVPTIGQPRDVVTPIFEAIEKTAHKIGKPIEHVGRVEHLKFSELGLDRVPARIDTGARLSSIWASYNAIEGDDLVVIFFGKGHPFYTGKKIHFKNYGLAMVSTSTGQEQQRYKVRLLVKIKGKRVRAWFTLADRSTQVYPILVGRNILLGKFIVDVNKGHVLKEGEQKRIIELEAKIREDTV